MWIIIGFLIIFILVLYLDSVRKDMIIKTYGVQFATKYYYKYKHKDSNKLPDLQESITTLVYLGDDGTKIKKYKKYILYYLSCFLTKEELLAMREIPNNVKMKVNFKTILSNELTWFKAKDKDAVLLLLNRSLRDSSKYKQNELKRIFKIIYYGYIK